MFAVPFVVNDYHARCLSWLAAITGGFLMDGRVESLCEKAIATGALSESECIEMLGFDELSEEA